MEKIKMILNEFETEKLSEMLTKIDSILQSLSKIEKMDLTQNEWLNTQEASEFLRVTPRSLFNYKERGLIPFSISGGKLLFRKEDLQRYLMENRVGSTTNNNRR